MKTSTALKLAKKIEKDCRKAQAYCQLSESAINDFTRVVNHCAATQKIARMLARCERTKLAPSDTPVLKCVSVLQQIHADARKASAQCEKATQTLESTIRIINISASCHHITQKTAGGWTPNDSVPGGRYRISFGGRRAGRTSSAVREALANPIAATTPSGHRRAPIKKLPRAIHLPGVAVEIDEDLSMMPPEAIGTIIDRTGG